jgi:hypothetical protein
MPVLRQTMPTTSSCVVNGTSKLVKLDYERSLYGVLAIKQVSSFPFH